jgi:hypothetical protein
MPSGNQEAYDLVSPYLQKIAAKDNRRRALRQLYREFGCGTFYQNGPQQHRVRRNADLGRNCPPDEVWPETLLSGNFKNPEILGQPKV